MSKKNDWKDREGVVYSTSSDFSYEYNQSEEQVTLSPKQQQLRVTIDKSGRAGKQVTLVTGFVGTQQDLLELTKKLKSKCGVGGSSKDGEIIIQGDKRQKLIEILKSEGYNVK